MDFFMMIVSLLGGLALFLYGMSMLGGGLEKASSGRMEQTLEKLTNNIFKSIFLGMVVTAAIQSSSATTVIVVGLVNARILKLRQAIGVIMGANIGTTVTAHILRLGDISSDSFFLNLLKPTTLAPLLGIVGILLFMGSKKHRRRDLGQIFLGVSILFTGMFAMEAAVIPLSESPAFAEAFVALSNPILGVLAGAIITAIIQSSTASVGILQALSSTGSITCSAAFPIIMGQNIGTCITPILASIGASKNARRTGVVNMCFNTIGTITFLTITYLIQNTIGFPFWNQPIDKGGIADFHTIFNVVVTILFLPFAGLLEKLVCFIVKDTEDEDEGYDPSIELDSRFLGSPSVALQHSRSVVVKMGRLARENVATSVKQFAHLDAKELERFRENENALDKMEDRLSNYLLRIPQSEMSEADSLVLSELLHIMSEFERIGDYAMNVVEAAETMHQNDAAFSPQALGEMDAVGEAVYEIVDIAVNAFERRDAEFAKNIEPLEEVIDLMEETLRERHIERLRMGRCSVDAAFPFVESLTNLERIADHCSNVGVYLISHEHPDLDIDHHSYLVMLHQGNVEHYNEHFRRYQEKYFTPIAQEN